MSFPLLSTDSLVVPCCPHDLSEQSCYGPPPPQYPLPRYVLFPSSVIKQQSYSPFSSNDGRTTTLDSCHYRHALSPSVQCTTSVKVFSHLRFPLFKPDLRLLALTSCIIPPSSMHIFPDSSPDSPLTSVSSSSSSRKRQNSSCLSNNLSQRREMGYIKPLQATSHMPTKKVLYSRV